MSEDDGFGGRAAPPWEELLTGRTLALLLPLPAHLFFLRFLLIVLLFAMDEVYFRSKFNKYTT